MEQRWLSGPEGKVLERKRDSSSKANILRTAAAFANTSGGEIVIGVDGDGSLVGVEDPLDAEERLANILTSGIRPLLSLLHERAAGCGG